MLTVQMLHCKFRPCKNCNFELSVSNSDCVDVDMIRWFSINFRYSQCSLFGGRVRQCRVGFFVAEVLPDHRGQNTVKGHLTQASKEKWRQALRGFFGGQVTERGRKRIPLLRQARLANKHHLQGWDNAWGSGTGLNITSFLATAHLVPPPNSARRHKIPMPPGLQSACPLLKCRSCLLLNDGATRLELNWADPCKRVMMSFLDQGSTGWPPPSQEAQQPHGLDQTCWLELLPDRVVSGLECGIHTV